MHIILYLLTPFPSQYSEIPTSRAWALTLEVVCVPEAYLHSSGVFFLPTTLQTLSLCRRAFHMHLQSPALRTSCSLPTVTAVPTPQDQTGQCPSSLYTAVCPQGREGGRGGGHCENSLMEWTSSLWSLLISQDSFIFICTRPRV